MEVAISPHSLAPCASIAPLASLAPASASAHTLRRAARRYQFHLDVDSHWAMARMISTVFQPSLSSVNDSQKER